MTFTAGLGANDIAAARIAGLRPIAQVMGACVIRSNNYSPLGAVRTARTRALWRLRLDARKLEADVVTGVQVSHTERRTNAGDIVEAVATGMAVAWEGRVPARREPVLVTIGIQDYWKLAQGGYLPAGMVMTTDRASCSAVSRPPRLPADGTLASLGLSNYEYAAVSGMVRDAYRYAELNVRKQVRSLRAEGVIGVRFDTRKQRTSQYVALTVTMTGTAVVPVRRDRGRALGERLLRFGARPDGTGPGLRITPVRHAGDPAPPSL